MMIFYQGIHKYRLYRDHEHQTVINDTSAACGTYTISHKSVGHNHITEVHPYGFWSYVMMQHRRTI
jgi:hypothetical protein